MVTAKEIPPGGVGEVKATFQSKGYQGTVKKSVTVETNDPHNARVSLSIAGEVLSDVTVQPRHFNFRNVSRDSRPAPIPLEISLREGRGLKIKEVSADNAFILLEEQKRDEQGASYTVSLAEEVPNGRLTGKIVVRTNSEKVPQIQIPFYAFVRGRVKLSPELLSFGRIPPGETSSREITLSRTGDKGFSVERVSATSDAITSEILTDKEGEPYRIRVTYNPGDRTKGSVSERLTIYVAGEGTEIIEVPVHGTIHGGTGKPSS